MKSVRELQGRGRLASPVSTYRVPPAGRFLALALGILLTAGACGAPEPNSLPEVNPNRSALAITPKPIASASRAASDASQAAPAQIAPVVALEAPSVSDVAAEPSVDGAEAYAYFLFHAWAYAIQTNDVDWWRGNVQGPAPWVGSITRVLEGGAEAGTVAKVADFQPYTVRRGTNPDNSNEHVVVLQAQVDNIYEVSSDGAQAVDTPAMLTEFAVILSYTDGKWLVKDAEMTQAQGQ